MLNNRELEKKIFACPKLSPYDKSIYPELDSDMMAKKNLFINKNKYPAFFSCVRKTRDFCFIDIYSENEEGYESRYTIREGYCLSDNLERNLIHMIHKYMRSKGKWFFVHFDVEENLETVFEEAKNVFPNWNLTFDADKAALLIEQMYFSSHRSGPREILYKAGLNNIAYELDNLPDYCMTGTTPDKIFGHGFNLKMLKILNNLRRRNYSEDSLNRFKKTYHKFSDYIGVELPNTDQWDYLETLCSEKAYIFGSKFKRSLYNILGEDKSIFGNFKYYYEYFEILYDHPELKTDYIPLPDNISYRVSGLVNMITDGEKYNKAISNRYKETYEEYSYVDETYSIVIPGNVMDFYHESTQQHNCLLNHIEDYCYEGRTYLFLRKNDKPDSSFVTLDIYNNRFTQVKGCCNILPDDEVFDFLIEYSKLKNMSVEVIEQNDDYDDVDDDFGEYLIRKFGKNVA